MSFSKLGDSVADGIRAYVGLEPETDLRKKYGEFLTAFSDGQDAFLRRCAADGFTPAQSNELLEEAERGMRGLLHFCESPIERMMLGPLMLADYRGFGTIPPKTFAPGRDAKCPLGDVVLVPQFNFLRYRLDLVVVGRSNAGHTKMVALECDGAEFHKDAEYEHLKNYALEAFGVAVVHASGHEITKSPNAVARRVANVLIEWKDAIESGASV